MKMPRRLRHPACQAICCGTWPCKHGNGAMTKSTAAQAGTDLAEPYEPTAEERAALGAYFDRKKQKAPTPRIKLTENGGVFHLSTDYPISSLGNALVKQALGIADADFFDGLLSQLLNVSTQ